MQIDKHHSLEELEAILAATSRPALKSRIQAIVKAMQGETGKNIATELGCSRLTVIKWVQAYNQNGLEGLSLTERAGRPPKLDRDLLKSLLHQMNSESHVPVESLKTTLARLQQLLMNDYQVSYSIGRLYDLVRDTHPDSNQQELTYC